MASRTRLRPPPVIRISPTAATDPTSTGWAPRTLAPVSRLGKEKPLMEMLINGRTVMIRDAIFHNHATGKPVFFLYKLKSVVYNALLSAGKLPLMMDYIYNIRTLEDPGGWLGPPSCGPAHSAPAAAAGTRLTGRCPDTAGGKGQGGWSLSMSS